MRQRLFTIFMLTSCALSAAVALAWIQSNWNGFSMGTFGNFSPAKGQDAFDMFSGGGEIGLLWLEGLHADDENGLSHHAPPGIAIGRDWDKEVSAKITPSTNRFLGFGKMVLGFNGQPLPSLRVNGFTFPYWALFVLSSSPILVRGLILWRSRS